MSSTAITAWPDGPAALNDVKNAAQANQAVLTEPITSLIDDTKRFEPRTMIALIDAATWRQNVLMEAICRKVGLDPEQIIADATNGGK